MKWAHPDRLHLLWLLIPLGFWLFNRYRSRRRVLLSLFHPDHAHTHTPGFKPQRHAWRLIFWFLGFGALLLTLAQPQWGFHWQESRQKGRDIMVVLDTSRSMLTQDVKPDRLQRAKWGIRDLTQLIQGDRIGLIAFAGSSFLQCPMTADYSAFLMTLDDVYSGIIPRGGTAIAKAVHQAVDIFKDEPAADRAILLITDGEDHEGNTKKLVEACKQHQIKVYAIGIGTPEGEIIPGSDQNGSAQYYKDRQGRVVKSSLNEQVLQELAIGTDGLYVRATAGQFGIDTIYQNGLRLLDESEKESRRTKIFEDRFIWFALFALACFTIESVIAERKGTLN